MVQWQLRPCSRFLSSWQLPECILTYTVCVPMGDAFEFLSQCICERIRCGRDLSLWRGSLARGMEPWLFQEVWSHSGQEADCSLGRVVVSRVMDVPRLLMRVPAGVSPGTCSPTRWYR